MVRSALLLLVGASLVLACEVSPQGNRYGSSEPCSPGNVRTCPCEGGSQGIQMCRYNGIGYRECQCGDVILPNDPGPPPDPGPIDPGFIPPEGPFTAIMIVDADDWKCNGQGSHGADIDAVYLRVGASTHVASMRGTKGVVGDGSACSVANSFTDIGAASWKKDAVAGSGYVSLAGGYIAGHFQGEEINSTHGVMVYEIGPGIDANEEDDTFKVFVATDENCAGPTAGCTIYAGSATGQNVVLLDTTGI